jgi:hypothetical protein
VSLLSRLLRVVLCLALVANGVGTAAASSRMAFEHETRAAAASQAAAPCHGHAHAHGSAETAAASTPHAHGGVHAHEVAAAISASTQDAPDCCKGKSCTCACVQYASVAFSIDVVSQAFAPAAPQPARLAVDYPQPRLPHLIRPPIG